MFSLDFCTSVKRNIISAISPVNSEPIHHPQFSEFDAVLREAHNRRSDVLFAYVNFRLSSSHFGIESIDVRWSFDASKNFHEI